MREILIGTSGWHYPAGRGTWNGVFYPARRPRGFDELAYYAEHFDTVEVNATFYRVPEPGLAEGWLRRTKPGFQFAVKLYQKFTHPDLFLDRPGVAGWDLSRADVDLFRHGIDPLARAGRLASLLLQFPASFHATEDARDYLSWLLEAFRDYPSAVELRHRSWSDAAEETRARLAAHRAAWVFIDEPKFRDSIVQRLDDAPGTLTYIRLHGRNAASWWEPKAAEDRYDYLYSTDELEAILGGTPTFGPRSATASDDPSRRQRVLVYLNNHFSAKAVANAAILRHHVGQIVPGTYLPEMVERYPVLDGIVTTEVAPRGLPL